MSTLSNMWKIIRPNYLQLNNVNPRINWEFNRNRHRMSKITSKLGLPERPKRPLNPYFLFSSEQRAALKVQNPGITTRELSKKLGELWKTYDPAKKERMKIIYKSQIDSYTRDIMSYYKSLTLEQQNMVKEYRENLKKQKIHKQLKQTYKELGKPKRPVGPFIIYAQKFDDKREAKMLYKDWLRGQSENWLKLSDKDKEPYNIEYAEAKKKFQSDVIEWETKMIEMGNTHLVRKSVLRDLQGPNIKKLARVKTSENNQNNESEKLKNVIKKVIENPLIENQKKLKTTKQSKAAVKLNKVDKLVDDLKSMNIKDKPTSINDELVNDEKLINKSAKVVTDSLIEKPDSVKPINKSKKVVNKVVKVVKDPMTPKPAQSEPIDTPEKAADKLIDEEKSINIKDQPATINDEKLINKTADLVKPINKSKKVVNKIVKVVKDPMTTNPAQFEPIDTPEKAADKLIDEEKSVNIKDQPATINDEKLINRTAEVVTDSLIEKPDLVKPINKSKKVVNKIDKVVEDPLVINPSEFEPIDTSKKVVEINKVDDKILNKADESIEENKVPKKLENKTVSNVESPINKTDESIKEPISNNKTISSLWNWWK